MAQVLNRTYKVDKAKKYKVLYVDDEEVNLRIFERAFRNYYDVHTAICGADAIELLESVPIDLIMTDQRMPNMTGVELLLKIVPKYPNIVRMIMTGFSDEEEILRVDDEVGLDRFMVKPWNKNALREEFDRALKLRKGSLQEEPKKEEEDYKTQNESLDLLESTMSLVETPETTALDNEINDLVESNKAKTRPEFIESDTNDLLKLKESLMPIQQELKLYIEDSIIIYDHQSVNKNGYWFGDLNDRVVLASFHSKTDSIQALTLNTFIGVMMTEMVYKEKNIKSDELLRELANRINVRYVNRGKKMTATIDIAITVIDKKNEILSMSGANHDLFFYDRSDNLKMIKGSGESLVPGEDVEFVTNKVSFSALDEVYFIPKNIAKETNDGTYNPKAIEMFLKDIHNYPMSMQERLFDEYNYKSVIGLRLV
ncbi:response regulator [Reichenbachiella versicolor]|uniref:response regulator n=1 Tax=Reichenbachiella versicolor TaxID=1821036 RepID=UPI000D6E7ED3|nr:response regulator [Reichenbachiella versicolor]